MVWGRPDSILEVNIDNIVNKINESKLFCKEPKYCIISTDTLEAIKHALPYKATPEEGGFYKKSKKICGLSIAICEDLQFGLFEVR